MSEQKIAHILKLMARGKDFDPFGEHTRQRLQLRLSLLGADIHFTSNSSPLLRLAQHAYAGLPPHHFKRQAPKLQVTLQQSPPAPRSRGRAAPAPLQLLHGAGLLAASTAASDYAVIAPRQDAALLVMSEHMSRFAYHARYELIEFAVHTLAARSQRLIPLHAACIGKQGRGILLMGDSGSGKSTLSLHCLMRGLDFLSEDSVFTTADMLRATGIANFLHVRRDALRWLGRSDLASAIRTSPVIRRRSGVEKYELDLRRTSFSLAPAPLHIVGIAFLNARPTRGALLRPMHQKTALARLEMLQPYATGRPEWGEFARNLARIQTFDLRRGQHPKEAAAALHDALTSVV